MIPKHWISAAISLVDRAGILDAINWAGQSIDQHLYVLMYHRVDEYSHRPWLDPGIISTQPKQLEEQLRLIATKYSPVSAEDVIGALQQGRKLPKNAVLVTVDDGYLDFQEIIFPIASRYGIRPVLFVPTAFIGQGVYWWDKLYLAVDRSTEDRISTPVGDFRIEKIEDKKLALQAIRTRVKQLPFNQAMQIVETLYDAISGSEKSTQRGTLDWDELRSLARAGVTIAAHSHTHPLLSRIPFEQACDEIKISQEIVKREIGWALPLFAIPDGKPEFFTARMLDFFRSEGFQFVVTTVEGSARLTGDLSLRFPRVGVWSGLTLSAFHYHLTPAYRLHKDG
jgi:peptidoglycan/xylan/chitin deacetylase (PgdA/CDA1 family)